MSLPAGPFQPEPLDPDCEFHPGRPTGRRCTRCGRPACGECLRPASVGSHCPACAAETRRSAPRQVRSPLSPGVTWVTNALIGLNLAMFAYGFTIAPEGFPGDQGAVPEYGLNRILVGPAGEWWRIVTSGFVHIGFFHLLMNMFALYQLGLLLERGVGHVRYAVVYATSLLCGSLGVLLLEGGDLRPRLTAGASGAVFGLLGLALIEFVRRGVPLSKTPVTGVLIINVLITFAIPGISIGGHLGGLAGGVLSAAILSLPLPRPLPPALVAAVGAAAFAACLAVAA